METAGKNIRAALIYALIFGGVWGFLWMHMKKDCVRTFETVCRNYNNVTDISPEISLPAGEYTITLKTEPSQSVPEAVLQLYSREYGSVYTSSINNMEDCFVYTVRLERQTNNLLARVVYSGYTGMEEERVAVQSMEIQSNRPLYNDACFIMALFLLLCLLAGWRCFHGRNVTEGEQQYIWLVGLAVLFASYPLLTGYLIESHDLDFHLYRIEGIKDAIVCGQFPVRIHPTRNSGYGYAAAAMYPELFLYIPALLRLLGVSLVMSYQVFLFLINAATASMMYYAVKSITGSSYFASMASVVYTLSAYRLVSMYARGALGETLALCFLPLVVSGIYHVFIGDKKKWFQLTAGAAGILQSHIISVLFMAVLAAFFGLVLIRRLFSEKRWLYLLKSAGLTLLLNLWFLAPFLDFYRLDLKLKHMQNLFYDNLVIPAQLFNLNPVNIAYSRPLYYGIQWEVSLTLGLPVTILLIGAAFLYFRRKKEKRGFGFLLLLFGLGCVLCSTTLIPWEILGEVEIIDFIVSMVQFPWRLLGLATAAVIMAAAVRGAEEYPGPSKEKQWAFIGITLLAVCGCVSFGNAFTQDREVYMRKAQALNPVKEEDTQEYLLYGTDESKLAACQYACSEGIQISGGKKNGTSIDVQYTSGDKEGWVEVPLLWYPGYEALEMSSGEKLPVIAGDNDVVRVFVPENHTGTVQVRYAGKWWYHGAELITLLTAAVCLGYWMRSKTDVLFYRKWRIFQLFSNRKRHNI